MTTIAEAIAEGARTLAASGVTEERLAAGSVLCHLLGVDRTHLLTKSEEELSGDIYQSFLELVTRRARGEPLQYITGHQDFYGLDFIVTQDVLIPRPETEFLVERVLELAGGRRQQANPLIVDVGTGSGCVAVTLAVHLPGARIIATDISSAALEVARVNARHHGVEQRIEFLEGDLFEPLRGRGPQDRMDIIASNPPYVVESELVQREVRDWEPHVALFGGADGLDFYRRLLSDVQHYLKPEGFVVLEIGHSQLDAISELIESSSLRLVNVISDLQRIPRTLSLRRDP